MGPTTLSTKNVEFGSGVGLGLGGAEMHRLLGVLWSWMVLVQKLSRAFSSRVSCHQKEQTPKSTLLLPLRFCTSAYAYVRRIDATHVYIQASARPRSGTLRVGKTTVYHAVEEEGTGYRGEAWHRVGWSVLVRPVTGPAMRRILDRGTGKAEFKMGVAPMNSDLSRNLRKKVPFWAVAF